MNQQQRSPFFNIDWTTVSIYVTLTCIGWINIYASVYNETSHHIFDLYKNYGKQLIYIVSAFCIGIFILLLDARIFRTFSPFFYIITLGLLVLVLFVGRSVGGNKSWIPIGSFRLQPTEFAKFATCLVLANYLSITNVRMQDTKTKILSASLFLLPMALTLMQPDTGSALTFLSLTIVLYREGLPSIFLIVGVWLTILFISTLLIGKTILIISLIIICAFLIYNSAKKRNKILMWLFSLTISTVFIFSVDFIYKHILEPHQKSRIDELLGISTDLRGAGYNVNQSKIAIGSGRLIGKGFLQGTQTKFDFVPEQSTDFIFCTVGEEWGFIGSLVIIGLYLFLLLRIVTLAERQRSAFARVYGYGVACIIFCHVFINIGMTIGIIPVIGIPLPYLSYGGSSLWGFTILLFILLKLDSNRMGAI